MAISTYDYLVRCGIKHPRDHCRVCQRTPLICVYANATQPWRARCTGRVKIGENAQHFLADKGGRAIRVHVAVHFVTRGLARDQFNVALLLVVHPVRHAEQLMPASKLAARFALGTHQQLELHHSHGRRAVWTSARHGGREPVILAIDGRSKY